MQFRPLIVACATMVSLSAGAQQAPVAGKPEAKPRPSPAAVPTAPSISPERLQALRQSLLSRIAAYDTTEQSVRKPTEAELAALNASAPQMGAGRTINLPSGGVAMRADPSSLSYLVVELQPDGKRSIRHAAPASDRAATAQPAKQGDARAQ